MAFVCFIADPADPDWPLSPSTPLVDLNAMETGGEGWGFPEGAQPDFGHIETDADWVRSDEPGGVLARAAHPPVAMSLPLAGRGWDDADAFQAARDELAAALDPRSLGMYGQRMGVMVIQLDGTSEPRYADFFPSPLPGIFNGGADELLLVMRRLRTNGMPVTIWRHPYLRRVPDLGSPRSVKNTTNGRHLVVDNPGTADALMVLRVDPVGGAELVEGHLSVRSAGNITEFESIYGISIEATTLSGNTSSVVDTDAEGGHAAETVFTKPSWTRRWRQTITVADSTGLAGRHRVILVVRVTDAGRYRLQLKWSAGGAGDDAEHANQPYPIDARHINASDTDLHYFEADLGDIEVPANATSIRLEGWAMREADPASTGRIRWDTCRIAPADVEHVTFSIPGHRGGASNAISWRGQDLDVADGSPRFVNDDVYLNSLDDAVEWPDGAQVLPAGRYTVRIRGAIRNRNAQRQRLGFLEVRRGDETLVNRMGLWSDRQLTRDTSRGAHNHWLATVHFEADGATSYTARVVMDNVPDGSAARIVVHRMQQANRRYASSAETLVIDGTVREAHLFTGTERVSTLNMRGGFPILAPGSNLIQFSWRDAHASGYDHQHPHHPHPKHVHGREANVTIDVIARDLTL